MSNKTPLTKKHLIGYALGDLGGCMTFGVMGGFMTRYYVNVALMDTAVLAILTLIWKICDALCNPVIGMVMDKSFAGGRNTGDKFRPWILRIAPLLAITAILVFTAPTLVTGASRLVVVFTTYLVYEFVYAMHNIAFGSLLCHGYGRRGTGSLVLFPGRRRHAWQRHSHDPVSGDYFCL